MKATARVKVRELRFLQIARIPVVGPEGRQDHLDYPIVNGVMLVPVKDAEVFNLNPGTIYNKMSRGELTRYNEKGQPKRGGGKGKVFFDPYEFYNNQ
jgi:hypothetical protein